MSDLHLSATAHRNLKRLYRFVVEIICIASSVAVFLLAIRTISTRHSVPSITRSTTEDDDIRKAVFRWQMERFGASVEYELRIGGVGPSRELWNRLGHRYTVLDNVDGSERYSYTVRSNGYFDNRTGRQIIMVSCDDITKLSRDTCIVSGGQHSAGKAGSWGDFHLTRVHGRWRVTSYDPKIFAWNILSAKHPTPQPTHPVSFSARWSARCTVSCSRQMEIPAL